MQPRGRGRGGSLSFGGKCITPPVPIPRASSATPGRAFLSLCSTRWCSCWTSHSQAGTQRLPWKRTGPLWEGLPSPVSVADLERWLRPGSWWELAEGSGPGERVPLRTEPEKSSHLVLDLPPQVPELFLRRGEQDACPGQTAASPTSQGATVCPGCLPGPAWSGTVGVPEGPCGDSG